MTIPSKQSESDIVDEFHKLYYESPDTWRKPFWLGIPAQKCPLDLWIYQEIIFEVKPDVIIECGTFAGGSALFLASVCDAVKRGTIITIDVEDREGKPRHKRIKYLLGSSTSKEIVDKVRRSIRNRHSVMVILDSDHSKDHVLKEMRIYSTFVTKGSYLIVEDTNINGHPVFPDFGPGPMEAVQQFLSENKVFAVDRSRAKFYMSFNPNGWLRRVA